LYTYIHATCCTFLYGVNKAILKTRICAYWSNVQQEDDDQSVEPTESETYKFFNPERHVNQRQIDILPGHLPDDIYFRHLRSFNPKQQQIYKHVIKWIKTKSEQLNLFYLQCSRAFFYKVSLFLFLLLTTPVIFNVLLFSGLVHGGSVLTIKDRPSITLRLFGGGKCES